MSYKDLNPELHEKAKTHEDLMEPSKREGHKPSEDERELPDKTLENVAGGTIPVINPF